MKRRKWDAKTKATIVLESLKGKPVATICLALEQAVQRQCPAGVQGHGLSLMNDNGCQPTSVAFMKACATLRITQAFTSDHNPKGNANTERLMRTLKEERLWLREWTSPLELERVLAA